MSAVCPNGHRSESDDYCDTCGSPIAPSAQSSSPSPSGQAAGSGGAGLQPGGSSLDLDPVPSAPSGPSADGAPTTLDCPNCHTANADGALFCEACGYDFTTGAMPRDPNAPAEPEPDPAGSGEP
ncbi:MAG: phosphopeptide-binding protein, partial [Humibacillus sp.]|nr:phosphopeptide-binding protein [Humibacillus sp.]